MKKLMAILLSMVLLLSLASCGKQDRPSPRSPVTLTVWHTYVEQMQTSFDALIDEFNRTVGAENGIVIRVTAVANAPVLNENIVASAKKDPGSLPLPDLAVVYPKVAVTLAEQNVLADWGTQFSGAELAAFVPQFLEEGRLGGETLYLLPIAKATEVLYLNRTIFDRFAAATEVRLEQLATFEGLVDAAGKYYAWTDAQTPDAPNDGKMFYYPDGLFNYSMIGFQQLGGDIIRDESLNFSDPIFARLWSSYVPPAVKGGIAVFDDYANYLAATGDIVCATSTSAGSSFFPATVIYHDNTKEDVTFDVLPYPVFEGGEKVVFQRGGGMCLLKSSPAKEYAAGLFLKWFTEAEQNLRFTTVTGYLPVTQAAFDDITAKHFPAIANPVVEKTLTVAADMLGDYRFYFPPVFDGFDSLQTKYSKQLRSFAEDKRREYLNLLRASDGDAALKTALDGAMDRFIQEYRP